MFYACLGRVCSGKDCVCSCPSKLQKVLWRGGLTPHSIAHANTVIMPEKLEVSWRPAEDLASLLPDFEIANYARLTVFRQDLVTHFYQDLVFQFPFF